MLYLRKSSEEISDSSDVDSSEEQEDIDVWARIQHQAMEDEIESLATTKELIDTTNDQSSNNDCVEYNAEYLELKSENSV